MQNMERGSGVGGITCLGGTREGNELAWKEESQIIGLIKKESGGTGNAES